LGRPDEARRDSECLATSCLATSVEQQIPPLRCGMTTKNADNKRICATTAKKLRQQKNCDNKKNCG
jgi:hypothetical protein